MESKYYVLILIFYFVVGFLQATDYLRFIKFQKGLKEIDNIDRVLVVLMFGFWPILYVAFWIEELKGKL